MDFKFVSLVKISLAAAALALRERSEGLLAFHRLDVPATLNITFLSTHLIENTLRNWREATGNVKRWNEKHDMVARWIASGLLRAEAGFRRIRHAVDLPHLAAALVLRAAASEAAGAAAAFSVWSARAGGHQPWFSRRDTQRLPSQPPAVPV